MSIEIQAIVPIALGVVVVGITVWLRISRIRSRKKGRQTASFSSLGNALQELQSIARPSVKYQIEEKLKQKQEEDGEGEPDDPREYYRRLKEKVDRQRDVT